MSFASRFMSSFLAALLVGGAVAQTAQTSASTEIANPAKAAYRSDPKFIEAFRKAAEARHSLYPGDALDQYKKASKIAAGQCSECLDSMYALQMKLAKYKEAAESASAMQEMATTPAAKSTAAFRRGVALQSLGGEKPKPAQLDAAHAAFAQSVEFYPRNPAALFSDGRVLAMEGRMDEARADFEKCVGLCKPADPSLLRAKHFAENPELATHKMAPSFEVTALDGTRFNLDAMGGRVVLVDFWATWCGPCNAELPHLTKMAKEFAGQPLAIISISVDKDDARWKSFVAKHEMTWTQYRDDDHSLSDRFAVTTIPRYFTIDSDGVLTSVIVDPGSDVEGKLKKLIARTRETHPVTVAAAGN